MGDYVRQMPDHGSQDMAKRPSLAMRLHIDVPLLLLLMVLTAYGLYVLYSASGQSMEAVTRQGRYFGLAYLLMMTRSMAFNRIEQRRNRWQLVQRWSQQLFPSAVRSPQEAAEADDLSQRVRLALEAIPANQRQVLEMAYYEGLSQSAIAERLQLPLGTVKTRSRQGLIRLRDQLIDDRPQS